MGMLATSQGEWHRRQS